ncbi:trichohyalin-like isoform X1 [Diaphorina citri]|uniref:Trichohyalin-like isoform X1 n=1 Tax=Diaphorina citri TaxID=121845 RepID=A0A1S4ECD2_DIACI|nr:trichohyalin-like isoform X2 [Diaphorina citri]XP_017299886.2 trichohyalin-like isoform X1 [Diaphorina citri]
MGPKKAPAPAVPTDPLKNETFVEEMDTIRRHSEFLNIQIEKIRERIRLLQTMNDNGELSEDDNDVLRQLQTELVNTVKDFDDSTKKLVGLMGLSLVETELIELNKHEAERYSIDPIPNEGIGILSKVPKIFLPLAKTGNVHFGHDTTPRVGPNTLNKYKIERGNTPEDAPDELSPEEREKQIIQQSRDCYEQLSEKSKLVDALKAKLRDRQIQLCRINEANEKLQERLHEKLEGKLTDKRKSKQVTFEDVSEIKPPDSRASEFVKEYTKRLNDKILRMKELERLEREIQDEEEDKDIENRLNYFAKLEKANKRPEDSADKDADIVQSIKKFLDLGRYQSEESLNENLEGLTLMRKATGDRSKERDRMTLCCKNTDLLDCEKFNLDECKRKRRSHADKLTAIQRMAKSDRERHTYTNLLRKLQEQQETIYKLESEMKSLTDPSKMDLSEMLRDEANEEIREQYEDLTDVLADRRNVEKKCRNQGRLVKMREADIKRSLEVLQKELQKRKIHRLIIKAEACELKAMLAKCEEKRTLQETNESRLKRTLKSVTKGIKLKREEFEDKKVLIEKLNARIDHLERKYPVLTKTTMC